MNALRAAKTVTALSIAVVAMTTEARKSDAAWCERQWSIESANIARETPPDYSALLRRWQGHAPRCAGTVAYEARLAVIYLSLNQPDKAREILKPLAGSRSEYRHLVDFAALLVDYFAALNGPTTTKADIGRLEGSFRGFTSRYPQFADGQGMLGGLQTLSGKHAEAIKSLELGLHSSMDVWSVYRNLTISYTAVGRYADAIRAGDDAYRLNRGVTSDQYFAYALAKADAGVGKLQDAETVLRVIAAKKPEVRRDPEFKEAVEFVMARMPHGDDAKR